MKKIENLGRKLSREEMKSIKGGLTCVVNTDCPLSCAAFPDKINGGACVNHLCKVIVCGGTN